MLHEIDDYLSSWGFKLDRLINDRLNRRMIYRGITYLEIELNSFHTDMYSINGSWINYTKENFQYLIEERLKKEAEKTNNLSLKREVKIRSIIKLNID